MHLTSFDILCPVVVVFGVLLFYAVVFVLVLCPIKFWRPIINYAVSFSYGLSWCCVLLDCDV